MVRLGLRLSLNGGREALVRLGLIGAAVAIGVVVLLSVPAEFHGLQATNARQCWECTTGSAPTGQAGRSAPGAALWNYGEDSYQGRTIKRLGVAALGPDAPVPPGLTALAGAGRYVASPAMAELLDSVPRDQLADRFPGTRAGVIGDAEYAAMVVGIPVAAACAALWSLRRVRVTPLGVSRRTTPPAPGAWRVLPLVAGLGLLAVYPLVLGTRPDGSGPSAAASPPPSR